MNNKPTPEQIEKLPKWAQEYIKDLERERFVAVRSLNEAVDKSTPTPFYYEDSPCTGEKPGPNSKRFYVQTNWIYVEHAGVTLQIIVRPDRPEIDLSWSAVNRAIGDVGLIPSSYQSARLVAKDNMR